MAADSELICNLNHHTKDYNSNQLELFIRSMNINYYTLSQIKMLSALDNLMMIKKPIAFIINQYTIPVGYKLKNRNINLVDDDMSKMLAAVPLSLRQINGQKLLSIKLEELSILIKEFKGNRK